MRIAHFIATNFYGGPERQIISHATHISNFGYVPMVVSLKDNDRVNEFISIASKFGIQEAMLRGRSSFHPGTVLELKNILQSKDIRLLVAHGFKANVVGRLATWLVGIPHIAVSRGWTGENSRVKFYENMDRFFLRYADQVVAVSEGQRKKVLACGVYEGKVNVIHNGIDLDSYPRSCSKSIRRELGITDDAIFIVSAGRLSPEKNHIGLIRAAKLILEKNNNVKFTVFGEGFLRPQLERAIENVGLQESFFLPGFRSDVHSLLHEADIFVLPSHTEGLPNVVLEAFACRKPVVATAVGGTPEVVRDGQDGLLTLPGDVYSLAEALSLMISSPQMRLKMGESGFEHARRNFNFSNQTAKYIEIYERLLKNKKQVIAKADA